MSDVAEKIVEEVIIPDFRGTNIKNIVPYLEKVGINLNKILLEESEYAKNTIISQSIKPGAKIKKGDSITLTVSDNNPIRFLPYVYQDTDSKNGDFLKRYLWIFQHLFNNITSKLDDIHKYFNPMEAPKEFFLWLASWFSINTNFSIPEEKMRLLVKEAVNLYRWRGTVIGITKFLEIITGVKPTIIENYLPINEYIVIDDKLVERPILETDTYPYYFTVCFPVTSDYFDFETIKKINDIVKTEKPAHSKYYITFVPKDKAKERDGFIIGDSIHGEI